MSGRCAWKFVADRLADLRVGLADEIVGGREAAEVGRSLQVPDDDARFHGTEYDMRPRVLGPGAAGGLMRLGLLQVGCLTHSGRVSRSRRRSNSSNSVQQPFWRVPQTQSARPSHKRKTSAIFQYEAIRPLEPSASVRRNAVHDLGYPHNAACLKLCGTQPVVDATLLVDL